MHAISSCHANRPTNTPTNRQDRLQYTALQLSALSNDGVPVTGVDLVCEYCAKSLKKCPLGYLL